MNYLITGGSGFIGSHLVECLLHSGHSVINVDNFDDFYNYRIKIRNTLESVSKSFEFPFNEKEHDIQKLIFETESDRYRLYYQDIRDAEGLGKIFRKHKIDMVVHLAALAGVRPSIEQPGRYGEVNVNGSINLWEICAEFNVNKVICASSSSVYGNNEKIPFTETDSVDQPVSPYAATKRSAEILGHVYHHLYHIDMIHLRFFTVYGPRQRPDLAIHKFAKLISSRESVPFFGDGTTARDYTYIDDIIAGVTGAMHYLERNTGVYEIVNLGESRMVSLNEMLSTIEENLSINAKRELLPMQPGDVLRTNADIAKARALFHYRPTTDFHFGIKKFVEWFLRNGS